MSRQYGDFKHRSKVLVVCFLVVLSVLSAVVCYDNIECVILDAAYKIQIASTESNIEKVNINQKFANIWKKKTNKYISRAISNASEKERKSILILASKSNKEIYELISEEEAWLEEKYGGGTIVPVLMSEYECALYREQAKHTRGQAHKWRQGDGSIVSKNKTE